jgi:hypothetical protein
MSGGGEGWHPIARLLVVGGGVLVLVGLFWQFGSRYLPLGKLPGDIAVEKESFKFYFPLGTSILLSVVLSLVAYLVGRFRS